MMRRPNLSAEQARRYGMRQATALAMLRPQAERAGLINVGPAGNIRARSPSAKVGGGKSVSASLPRGSARLHLGERGAPRLLAQALPPTGWRALPS